MWWKSNILRNSVFWNTDISQHKYVPKQSLLIKQMFTIESNVYY